MTDIVDRLNDSLSAGYSELRKEAAAEIMQLRAKIYDLTINIEYFNKLKTSYEELIGELQEERDALKQAHLNGMGASREAALMAKLEAAEKEVAHIKEVEFPRKVRAVAVGWATKCVRLEQERTIDEQRIADLMAELNRVVHANDALRAKIEAMAQQEPFDANSDVFRSAFEAALKAGYWPAARQGDGYRSPTTQIAWLLASSTIDRLKFYPAPGAQGE